jgi:cytochrome c553
MSICTLTAAIRISLMMSLTLVGALLAAAAAAQDPGTEVTQAMQLSPDPARGKLVFARCVTCHRATAHGRTDGAIPRLSGQHASVIIKQVSDIRTGRRLNPDMKPYVEGSEMTAQGLADVAAYLQALPITGAAGKGPGTALDRGKALFSRDCTACHGQNGEGLGAAFFPMLAAQHYGYLLRELELIRDGKRGNSNPGMVQLIKAYTAADLEAVADYASRLPPPGR